MAFPILNEAQTGAQKSVSARKNNCTEEVLACNVMQSLLIEETPGLETGNSGGKFK